MLTLVTGGTGFIGANLVEALNRKGWQARVLRRPSSALAALEGLTYDTAIGDVTDGPTLVHAMQGVDIVFHVAAAADYWRTGVDTMMRVNVDGTRTVLQAALDAGVKRVVFTSSCAALGKPPFGQTLDERAKFNLRPNEFAYGYTKHLAENVCREYTGRGLDIVIVNPSVVLGPRDINLISGSMIVEAARRGGIPIVPPGGVSVIDVADVCAGHIAAAEHGRTGERYILTSENLWYAQLFGLIAAAVGGRTSGLRLPRFALRLGGNLVDFLSTSLKWKLPINGEQTRFSAETFWFDASKARHELGLTPASVNDAVRRTYAWYVTHGFIKPDTASRDQVRQAPHP